MTEKKITSKRSKTGTRCTTVNFNDLAKLLTAAGKAGVQSLEVGDIKVKFSHSEPIESRIDTHQALLSGAGSSALLSAPDIIPQETITSPEHRARLEELEEEQLMLDDPIGFETLAIDRIMGNEIHA